MNQMMLFFYRSTIGQQAFSDSPTRWSACNSLPKEKLTCQAWHSLLKVSHLMVEASMTFNIEVVWVWTHNRPQIHNLELLCPKPEAFLSDSDHIICPSHKGRDQTKMSHCLLQWLVSIFIFFINCTWESFAFILNNELLR